MPHPKIVFLSNLKTKNITDGKTDGLRRRITQKIEVARHNDYLDISDDFW